MIFKEFFISKYRSYGKKITFYPQNFKSENASQIVYPNYKDIIAPDFLAIFGYFMVFIYNHIGLKQTVE